MSMKAIALKYTDEEWMGHYHLLSGAFYMNKHVNGLEKAVKELCLTVSVSLGVLSEVSSDGPMILMEHLLAHHRQMAEQAAMAQKPELVS